MHLDASPVKVVTHFRGSAPCQDAREGMYKPIIVRRSDARFIESLVLAVCEGARYVDLVVGKVVCVMFSGLYVFMVSASVITALKRAIKKGGDCGVGRRRGLRQTSVPCVPSSKTQMTMLWHSVWRGGNWLRVLGAR